jgi:Fe-S-cluster containining protein
LKKRASITSASCRSCGACCLGGLDDGHGWADCTIEDVVRMSRHVRDKLVGIQRGFFHTDSIVATPTKFSEAFGATCAFLRGTPGERVSCSIYATRPRVCERFRPGSDHCRSARRELGLPT